jgi:hypothetical protein
VLLLFGRKAVIRAPARLAGSRDPHSHVTNRGVLFASARLESGMFKAKALSGEGGVDVECSSSRR